MNVRDTATPDSHVVNHAPTHLSITRFSTYVSYQPELHTR